MPQNSDEVLCFISRFTLSGNAPQVETVFSCGCCYWFAKILCERFDGVLFYNATENHFAAMIGEQLYDIRGEIEPESAYIPWDLVHPMDQNRIARDCINF